MANIVFVTPYDHIALGARLLSAILKKAGHKTRLIVFKGMQLSLEADNLGGEPGYQGGIVCCTDREYGKIRDLIKDFDTDIIGVSFASHCFGLSVWLSQNFRKDFPSLPIVWGGIDPTIHPELGIESCDYMAIGEAEHSFLELVEALSKGERPTKIDGFWVNKDGEVFRNPMREAEQNLDVFPIPDWVPEEKYKVAGDYCGPLNDFFYMIMTQRGCPYKCSYCANVTLTELYNNQKLLRRRSVDHVLNELHYILKIYPELKFIHFFDDIFTINKKWVREFAPRYRAEIGLPFWCYTYPGQCDEETAMLLKEMNVEYVRIGIQSGSKRILKEIFHRRDPDTVGATARIFHKLDIPQTYDILLCNPFETVEDNLETLEVLLDLPHPFHANATNPINLYMNSPITRMAQERGFELVQPEGMNGYLAKDDNDYQFWRNIYQITQFPMLDKDFIRSLARNEYLKKNPQLLENFRIALKESALHGEFYTKKYFIEKLSKKFKSLTKEKEELERKLATIRGKRLYKLAKKIKSFLPVSS